MRSQFKFLTSQNLKNPIQKLLKWQGEQKIILRLALAHSLANYQTSFVSNCPKISEFILLTTMTVQPMIPIVVRNNARGRQKQKDSKADNKASWYTYSCKYVIGIQTFQSASLPLFWDSIWATSSRATELELLCGVIFLMNASYMLSIEFKEDLALA